MSTNDQEKIQLWKNKTAGVGWQALADGCDSNEI